MSMRRSTLALTTFVAALSLTSAVSSRSTVLAPDDSTTTPSASQGENEVQIRRSEFANSKRSCNAVENRAIVFLNKVPKADVDVGAFRDAIVALGHKGDNVDHIYEGLKGFAGHFTPATIEHLLAHEGVHRVYADCATSAHKDPEENENKAKAQNKVRAQGKRAEEKRVGGGSPQVGQKTVHTMAATWGLNRINKDNAPAGGYDVKAYVLDTGVRITHSQFQGRAECGCESLGNGVVCPDQCDIWMNYGRPNMDSIGYDSEALEHCGLDTHGHGTHCAATIAGVDYGVAPQVHIVPYKVLSDDGYGYTSWTIAAESDILSNGHRPAVVSMSLGGSGNNMAEKYSLDALVADNVTVVVAAGNEGDDACKYNPAWIPSVITVAASSSSDSFAWYSNHGECVDIIAPGSSVLAAGVHSDTSTSYKSGTSMATPHVAGAAAILLSLNPFLTPQQVLDQLLSAAKFSAISGLPAGTTNALLQVGNLKAPDWPQNASDLYFKDRKEPRAGVPDRDCVLSPSSPPPGTPPGTPPPSLPPSHPPHFPSAPPPMSPSPPATPPAPPEVCRPSCYKKAEKAKFKPSVMQDKDGPWHIIPAKDRAHVYGWDAVCAKAQDQGYKRIKSHLNKLKKSCMAALPVPCEECNECRNRAFPVPTVADLFQMCPSPPSPPSIDISHNYPPGTVVEGPVEDPNDDSQGPDDSHDKGDCADGKVCPE